jgi:DNA-3-methyladenine glycosylase II
MQIADRDLRALLYSPAVKRKAAQIEAGVRHLGRVDPVMRRLMPQCTPLTELRLQRDRFFSLANSILSQQISIHAARSIKARLHELTGPAGITPEAIGRLDVEELRATGISRQKAAYLKDLAEKVRSGDLALGKMGRLGDERVVRELVRVRGVGVWTAQMFLIFSLGRLDVFPHDDYGVRAAIRKLYGLDELPGKAACMEVAAPWRPYGTIASWYCWRSHELDGAASGGL